MKLKKILRYTVSAAAAVLMAAALTGCHDRDFDQEGPGGGLAPVSDDLTVTLNVDFPNTAYTRSTTESGGGSSGDKNETQGSETDNGYDAEGKLSGQVSVYFFGLENESDTEETLLLEINSFVVKEYDGASNGNNHVLEAQLKPSELKKLCGKKPKIYVVGNVSSDLSEANDIKTATFTATQLDDSPLGVFNYDGTSGGALGNSIPLSNTKDYTIDFSQLSGETDGEILQSLASVFVGKGYNATDRSLNLSEVSTDGSSAKVGSIELERGVARVDFKPKNGNAVHPNVYAVGEIPNLYARMTSLQIVNVSRKGYLFRHISGGDNEKGYTDGTLTEGFTGGVFGIENGNSHYGDEILEDDEPTGQFNYDYNWIVDTDWYTKSQKATTGPAANYFFNQPTAVTGVTGLSDYYAISSTGNSNVENGIIDIADLDGKDADVSGYYAWCYINENTLPSTKAMTKGLCTGIAFHTYLCDADGYPLKDSDFITLDEYKENQNRYEQEMDEWNANMSEGTATEEDKPKNPNDGKVTGEFKQIGSPDSDYWKLVIGNAETICKKTKVKVISNPNRDENVDPVWEDEEAFEMIYYYFFRHNIDKDHVLGTVGPMQFAVVRNSIYKLSVGSLNGLPEAYDPKDPAEPQQNYISVELRILAWARKDISVIL